VTEPAIILDCDPGHDDAIAIVVAARHTDLLGITTVAGNAPLDRTTRNALVLRELLAIDVPIHSGAERPLIEAPRHAPQVHGASGLDGADLPEPRREVDGIDAAGFIIDTCRAQPGAWIVAVGPLTNVALALRSAPDLAGTIAGISLMGGGRFGNRTAVAEFNIWADPEAAAIVFGYGGPLTMAGLHVTHQLLAMPARIDAVRAVGGQLATTLADLLAFFASTYTARYPNLDGPAIHDPLAVLALTHPELFQRVPRHVGIELTGSLTRGMTVIDERDVVDQPPATCDVLTHVDHGAAFGVIVDAITAFAR
jgi:inosine-uridine nucleoside N-ribohydrolase